MGKLIKRNNIIKAYIEATPDVELKQGDWIYCEDENGQDGYECSECDFFAPWYYSYEDIEYIKKYHYCPNCGAKMR